jgi:hypothetical protein
VRKLSIFFGLLLIPCFLYLLFSLQINAQSDIPDYSLKVDRVRFTQFLFENGYYSGEGIWKSARITLTNERQPFMAITKDKNVPPFQSVTIKKDQKGTTILAHYDSDILEEILSFGEDGQRRINRTILAYFCVAQSETKTGIFDRDICYQKAENYLEDNSDLIFRLEKRTSKTGFHLVKTAYAAGCTGLVECEPGVTTCTCSVGGASCINSGNSCGPSNTGTCQCTFTCSSSGGGAMDYYYCSEQTDQLSCLSSAGAEALCQAKGMCLASGCFWNGTGGGGGGGGGCTCNCMSAIAPSFDGRVRSQRTINLTFLNSPTAKFARNAPSSFLLQFSNSEDHLQTTTSLHSPNSPARLFFSPHDASYIPMATYL